MASPIDPRFLLLPLLERGGAVGNFQPLDQLVVTPPDCDRLPLENAGQWKLEQICDVNGELSMLAARKLACLAERTVLLICVPCSTDRLGPDMILVRLNQEKVLEWLCQKVERLATAIHTKRQSKKKVDNFVSGFTLSASNVGVAVTESAETPEITRGGTALVAK